MRIGRKTKGLFFGLILVLVCGLMLAGCGTAAPEKTLKIGYMDWNTGMNAFLGNQCLEGARWVTDVWNAKGGVLGRRVELVVRNPEAKPEQAARQAFELVYEQGCEFLTGTSTSSTGVAVSTFAKEHQIIFSSQSGASRILTDEMWHRYFFRAATANTIMRARSAAGGVIALGKTKYFYFAPDYEWGRRMCADYMAVIKESIPDAEVVGEAWSPLGEVDYTPYITSMLASGAEVILSAHYGGDLAAVMRQGVPYGLFDKVIYANPTVGDLGSTIPMGWDLPEGMYGSAWYVPYWDTPENAEFIAAYRAWTGIPDAYPDDRDWEGYMIHDFLFRAIEEAGSFDTEEVVEAAEGLQWVGAMGPMEMRAFDHQIMYDQVSGITTHDPAWPNYAILGNLTVVPFETCGRTIDELIADGHPGRPDLK